MGNIQDPMALVAKLTAQLGEQSYPPVHLWNPPFCGDIDMRIAKDGTWFYRGTPIGRPAMVKMFSSILRLDDDGHYYLVTPVEKVRIQVDDAPLLVTQMQIQSQEDSLEGSQVKEPAQEQVLCFETQVGDRVIASTSNPITVALVDGEPRPYLLVRDNLRALIHRNVFYLLVELGEIVTDDNGAERLQVASAGVWFDFGAI